MTFSIPCGWYHVVDFSNPGTTTARDVQTILALQWMALVPSICAASVNRLRLQKTLIADWMSNKIQVWGTPYWVRSIFLPLRPKLTSRCLSWHILNPVSNPNKLAALLAKYRFPELCVYSIIIWVALWTTDRETWSIYVPVLSAVWEVSQGVTLLSPGSLVDCVCTYVSKLQSGQFTSMWVFKMHS